MKLTIEPTDRFFMAGEVMVRLWQGTYATGLPVVALVAAVALPADATALGLVPIPPPDDEEARRWAAEVMARMDATGEG